MIKLSSRFRIILNILIFTVVAFIWINSLLPARDSGALSQGFMNKLRGLFGLEYSDLPISEDTLHTIIRKLAHTFEFACLGAVLCLRLSQNPPRIAVFSALPLAVAVAITDELIQALSDRACRVTDMLIDSFGASLGIVFALFIIYLIRKKQTRC